MILDTYSTVKQAADLSWTIPYLMTGAISIALKDAFNAFVGAMASPQEMEARGHEVTEKYRFWFKLLNNLAVNFARARLSNGTVNGNGSNGNGNGNGSTTQSATAGK